MLNTKKVIVTGAAGYIGGQICIELKSKGYFVIGVDKRHRPHLDPYHDIFLKDDFDSYLSHKLIRDHKPVAIIHCAGTSLVGPSIKDPETYFYNNVQKTINYLNVLKNTSIETKFIFSSSASVYGLPVQTIDESHPTNPISPYGDSKLMIEKVLAAYSRAYNLNYVSFRYFNACGADQLSSHGQEPDATHIFARVFEAGLNNSNFVMNGINYPTEDGTCVRDYIHVEDIANAHVIAIEENISGIYNIGSRKGYSNFDVFYAVEEQLLYEKDIETGIKFIADNPREGDPAILIADSSKLQKDTSWKPKKEMKDIVEDLYYWYTSKTYRGLGTFNPL